MNKFWPFILLLSAASLTLACGSSSSGRQLQSITINSTVSGQLVQFTATGTFSAPPTTVTPLPVSDWGIGPFAPPPATVQYTLTTQPFVFDCLGSAPGLPVSTLAPSDPNAPGHRIITVGEGGFGDGADSLPVRLAINSGLTVPNPDPAHP